MITPEPNLAEKMKKQSIPINIDIVFLKVESLIRIRSDRTVTAPARTRVLYEKVAIRLKYMSPRLKGISQDFLLLAAGIEQ